MHVIAVLEKGGAERQLQILVNNLCVDRFKNGILYLYEGSGAHDLIPEVDLIRLDRGLKWNIPSLWYRIFHEIENYYPDILHLWLPEIITIPAAFAGMCMRIPVVSAQRGSLNRFKILTQFNRWFRNNLLYIQHLMGNRIVTNFPIESEPVFFRRLFKRKKGIVIPNAVFNYQVKKGLEPTLSVRNGSFLIWFTARMDPEKRLDLLIRAFIRLHQKGLNLSLAVCGEGLPKWEKKLQDLVRQAELEEYVIFLGYRNDWHNLAKKADLFILPSMSEGCSNVLLEAMSLGLPCIATNIAGIRHLVSHKEDAWLVEAGSENSLTEAIEKLYRSPIIRKKLSLRGRQIASRFSTKQMLEAYTRLYQEIFGQKYNDNVKFSYQ